MAMASVKLGRQSSIQDSPRSPKAKLGMQVEDLWYVQEPELSPNDKLNACFESIPVSAFPIAPQWIEIKSDASQSEAVQILAQNKILSAPVVDVDAPEDASCNMDGQIHWHCRVCRNCCIDFATGRKQNRI